MISHDAAYEAAHSIQPRSLQIFERSPALPHGIRAPLTRPSIPFRTLGGPERWDKSVISGNAGGEACAVPVD